MDEHSVRFEGASDAPGRSELIDAAQRRALLAERLLIDVGVASTPTDAAAAVVQALTTVGDAAWAEVVRHADGTPDGPTVVLARSGQPSADAEPVRATLSEPGGGLLELVVAEAHVPPRAVEHALRALGVALDRLTHHASLLHDARTDPLTGLLNRRALDERLASEFARQGRGGGDLSALLIDLDGFKGVNDRHGHAEGDRVLREVARALLSVARVADDVSRLGGDEFALLLPGADEVGSAAVAERLLDVIRQRSLGVTASVGIATHAADDDLDPAELLRAADEALYRAKENGRDRAVTASRDRSA